MSTRLSKLEREQKDAKEHLEQCREELENALSMRNLPRIQQCQKWFDEASSICKELGCNIDQERQ